MRQIGIISGESITHPTKHEPVRKRPDKEAVYRLVNEPPIAELVIHWNSLPGLRVLNVTRATRTLARAVAMLRELLSGTWDRTPDVFYSYDEIRRAMDHFSVAVSNPAFRPFNKSRYKQQTIVSWILNPVSQFSLFLKFIEPPEPLPQLRCPPDFLYALLRTFQERTGKEPPQQSIYKFADAAKHLDKFARERGALFLEHVSEESPEAWVELLYDAIQERFGAILPGNIGSAWTYEQLLPTYLEAHGRLLTTSEEEQQYTCDGQDASGTPMVLDAVSKFAARI